MQDFPITHCSSPRVFALYQACLTDRMRWWFDDEVRIEVYRSDTLKVTYRHEEAYLTFLVQRCQWSLLYLEETFTGSFDRITKKLRQFFSGR